MSVKLNVLLDLDMTTGELNALLEPDTRNDPKTFALRLAELIVGADSGTQGKGTIYASVAPTGSTATVTFTGQPVAAETVTVNGEIFTFRASGAVAEEANIGQQISESAANTAASRVSAVQSTLTFTGAPAAGETFTFCGYTFTFIKNLAVTIASSTGNTVTLSSTTGMAAGDTLSQGGLQSVVESVDSATVVTVADSGIAWTAGAATSGTRRSSPYQVAIGANVTATALAAANAWNGIAACAALATATPVAGVVTFDSTAAQGYALTAINLAAAINASAQVDVTGVVTASASGAVVTLTTVAAGKGTTLYTMAESATNVAVSAFTGGGNGSAYSYTL